MRVRDPDATCGVRPNRPRDFIGWRFPGFKHVIVIWQKEKPSP